MFSLNLRVVIGNFICHPLIGRIVNYIFKGKIPSRGLRIISDNSFVPSNIASIFWGLYERKEINFINKYLDINFDIIELGSSLGVVTLELIKLKQKNTKLVCVEANPYLISSIHSNIQFNFPDKSTNLDILNKAIDYSNKSNVQFKIEENNLGSHINSNFIDIENSEYRIVEVTTLKEIVENYSITNFTLVSDIEGAEIGFILNEEQLLVNCQQMIIELHPVTYNHKFYSINDMCQLIQELHKFKLTESKNSLFFFEKKTRKLESP